MRPPWAFYRKCRPSIPPPIHAMLPSHQCDPPSPLRPPANLFLVTTCSFIAPSFLSWTKPGDGVGRIRCSSIRRRGVDFQGLLSMMQCSDDMATTAELQRAHVSTCRPQSSPLFAGRTGPLSGSPLGFPFRDREAMTTATAGLPFLGVSPGGCGGSQRQMDAVLGAAMQYKARSRIALVFPLSFASASASLAKGQCDDLEWSGRSRPLVFSTRQSEAWYWDAHRQTSTSCAILPTRDVHLACQTLAPARLEIYPIQLSELVPASKMLDSHRRPPSRWRVSRADGVTGALAPRRLLASANRQKAPISISLPAL
jgi:hypothetical protein